MMAVSFRTDILDGTPLSVALCTMTLKYRHTRIIAPYDEDEVPVAQEDPATQGNPCGSVDEAEEEETDKEEPL